jgi:hypothetical protein
MTRGPAQQPLTLRALIDSDRGINVVCKCGHKTSLLPAQLATMAHPETRVLDFKRRFRCTMCGRSGASSEVRLSTFDVAAAFANPNRAQDRRAPRQTH